MIKRHAFLLLQDLTTCRHTSHTYSKRKSLCLHDQTLIKSYLRNGIVCGWVQYHKYSERHSFLYCTMFRTLLQIQINAEVQIVGGLQSDSFSLWHQFKFPISIFKVGICYLAITLTYYHCAHFLFISQRSMIQKIWLQI